MNQNIEELKLTKIKWLKINKWLKLFYYKFIEIINDYRI